MKINSSISSQTSLVSCAGGRTSNRKRQKQSDKENSLWCEIDRELDELVSEVSVGVEVCTVLQHQHIIAIQNTQVTDRRPLYTNAVFA